MKTIKFLLILVLISTKSIILGQNTNFIFEYNTDRDFSINNIIETNGAYYFAGSFQVPDSKHFKGMIGIINKQGIFVDSTFIESHSGSIFLTQIFKDNLNRLIIAGSINDIHPPYQKGAIYLSAIDSNLNVINEKKFYFDSTYRNAYLKVREGYNNNFFLIGSVFTTQYDVPNMYLYKVNNSFDSINAKFYFDTERIIASDVKELPDKTIWAIRGVKPYYMKFDSLLNIISIKEARLSHFVDANYGIKWDTDTSFYLAGDYVPDGDMRFSNHDIGFFRQQYPFDTGAIFNSWGALTSPDLTQDTIDFPAFYGALDFNNKDTIFIGGIKNMAIPNIHYGNIPSWYVLIQTDSLLNIRWERFYGGDAYYTMTNLAATNDGGCIMVGTKFDYKAHPYVRERDIYIIKVNSKGLIASVNGEPSPIVHEAIVFPNPGRDYLRVRVAMQHKHSDFKLYDIKGRLILKKHIEGKIAEINTQFLETGTYIYTVTNNNGLNEKGKWIKK